MGWISIKSAIKDMLEEKGYSVFNSKKLARRDINTFVVIDSGDERNIDRQGNISANKYRQEMDFSLWVHHKNKVKTTDLDLVVAAAKDQLDEFAEDIKKIFGTTYNAVGDAGAIKLQYKRRRFIIMPKETQYAPVRLELHFIVQYIEERS